MIFVGYLTTSKGYLLLCPKTGLLEESRNVVFDEGNFDRSKIYHQIKFDHDRNQLDIVDCDEILGQEEEEDESHQISRTRQDVEDEHQNDDSTEKVEKVVVNADQHASEENREKNQYLSDEEYFSANEWNNNEDNDIPAGPSKTIKIPDSHLLTDYSGSKFELQSISEPAEKDYWRT